MTSQPEKVPFYVSKPDDKYNVLFRPIGIDTNTSNLSTRIVDASSGKSSTVANSVTHIIGNNVIITKFVC